VVQELVTRGLVDDRAFALQRARTLVQNRHLSPRRVRGELRDRGVAEEIIEVTIQEVFEGLDEEGTARAAAARRLKALAHLSPPVAERHLAGYLLRRGFLPETVHRVVTTLMQEHGRPTPDR
jgi:regulatory protein